MQGMETSETCSCNCSCDYDPNRVWRRDERKARKEHVCEECNEVIEVGARYAYTTYLPYDGPPWQVYICCLPCEAIKDEWADCCYIGGLREAIWECLGLDYVTGETIDDDEEEEEEAEEVGVLDRTSLQGHGHEGGGHPPWSEGLPPGRGDQGEGVEERPPEGGEGVRKR